jgi:predicted dehydrogenase
MRPVFDHEWKEKIMGLSVGMVGLGSFGTAFIRLFRHHPLVDRIALCDVHPDRVKAAADRFSIRECYGSLEEICRTDLDALVIITQPWLHAPQAIKALEAGKHVWSAVPIISLPDGQEMLDWCDKLIQACRRTGMHYMLAETSYFRAEAMFARRMARQGAFGEFVYAEGHYFHDYQTRYSNLIEVEKRRWGAQWDMSKSGMTPMHYPTHSIGGFLDVVRSHVTKVAAVGYIFPNDEWHRLDTIHKNPFSDETALMKLSNGMSARICEFRRVGRPNYEGFSLYGTEGCLLSLDEDLAFWADKENRRSLTLEEMRDPLPAEVVESYRAGMAADESVYGGHGGSHGYLVHEFVSAIAEGRLPAINAWQAARYLAPGVIAHRSAMRDGEWLEVPDWGDAPGAPAAKNC